MPIFVSPDRTKYPPDLQFIPCPDLEAITGADMCISRFPMLPTAALETHIKHHALFVQVKIGYDILSFDAIHNFAARIQKCHIPKSQAILLRIGEYWEDELGLFRVKSQKPFGQTTWNDYQRHLIACDLRGLNVVPSIRDISELGKWIDNRLSIADKLGKETKEIYTKNTPVFLNDDDFFQPVIEVPKDDIKHILCAGLPDFGPKRAMAVEQYLMDHRMPVNLFNAFYILVGIDETGKSPFKIAGIGEETHKRIRKYLFGDSEKLWNMRLSCSDEVEEFTKGAKTALEQFHLLFQELVGKGKSAKDAYNEAMISTRNGINQLIEF